MRIASLRLWTAGIGQRIPTVYFLTDRGADTVEAATGIRPQRCSKGDPQPETIYHRLSIVRTKLTMDAACRASGLALPKWILEQDRDRHAPDSLPPNQRRILYHAFPAPPAVCTCQPDAACRMTVPKEIARPAAGTNDLIGFFENDRSTEGRKQVQSKLPGYARLITGRTFCRYFPDSDKAIVRVFWVCHNWERIHSLCEKLKSEPVAQYFRFTTESDLTPENALTQPIWHAVDGKRREIIRLPASEMRAIS